MMHRRDFLGLAALSAVPVRAQSTGAATPDPEGFYKGILRDDGLKKQGEDFCWHAAYDLHRFLEAYLAWGDTAWLDWGVRYYEFLLGQLLTGPDGYQGWIGPYEYDNSVWCDVHVGDAILFNGLVAFSEAVLAEPKLHARYRAAAEKYVALARKHLFEKWDARGTWETDGPYGAYRSWNRYFSADLKTATVREDVRGSSLALPFNKQDDIAAVALKLYRITGEEQFRERATRIFSYQKSRLLLVGSGEQAHYCWNYWEPFGFRDADLPGHKFRHWIGVHPERPYQQGEVANMVEAFHTGVVFDERDMRRLVNTNLKVMWNGELETPAWHNSNTGIPGTDPKQTAGTLWPALAEFDGTLHELYGKSLAKGRGTAGAIAKAYFESGGQPVHAKGRSQVFEFPHSPCTGLIFAAALPATFSAKEGTLLACESLTQGVIEVAQYSADGTRKLATLRQAELQWFLFHRWSGMEPGRYRIRWTFENGGYREAPVVCT